MGWSERYWEDVRSELEGTATPPEPTGEDADLGQAAPGLAAARLGAPGLTTLGPPARSRPADTPELD